MRFQCVALCPPFILACYADRHKNLLESADHDIKYALARSQKTNEIGLWAESISQDLPFCDLSDEITN
jgi:hypothetical protein